MLFLSLLTATSSAQAQTATTFSGDATGVIAVATAPGAGVNTTTAPTGALTGAQTVAPGGGRRENGVLTANVFAGVFGTANALTTGVITTRTSGGTAGAPDGGNANTSQSQAQVANLNLGLLRTVIAGFVIPGTGLNVTADLITANTNCSCATLCTGTSQIVNLRVNGILVDATLVAAALATPNQPAIGVNVPGIGTVNLFINQQTGVGTGDITVNALRIQTNLLAGTFTTDIIVAQAHSDITCTAVVAGSNLTVTKVSSINGSGSTITNTITVANSGPDAATGVTVTDVLQGTNFQLVTTTAAGGFSSVTTPAVGTNGTVTVTLANPIPAGQSRVVTITSSVPALTLPNTSFANTATATATNDATNPNTSNTTSVTFQPNIIIIPIADLSVAKTSTVSGNTITNTVTVTNNSLTTTATNVVVMDTLPAETFFVSSNTTSGFALANPGFGQNGTVTGTLGSLAAGASASFTVVSEVFQSTEPGTVVTNTAAVTSSTTDLFTANNTATTNVFVGFATAPNGFAPAFSGRAIGAAAGADVNIFGLVTSIFRVGIGDTGPLPSTGGRLTGGISAAAGLTIGGVPNALTVSAFDTRTSGGIQGVQDGGNVSTSQSQAIVNNLNVTVLGVNVTATTLTANTRCMCGTVCVGDSSIENLSITGVSPAVVAAALAASANTPNTTIEITVGAGTVVRIILNEQIIGNGSITVNALRIETRVNGIVTSNIIVAQAHSDIACFEGRPTAAGVSIAGRVLSPSGRGISRARVLLTDTTGQTRTVMTNPFGYYSFGNVAVGGTYIFEVRDKRYTFTPQTLSLTGGMTNFNFKAQQ
jgi:uncharacterized repeat protein (TIGR01451 family)